MGLKITTEPSEELELSMPDGVIWTGHCRSDTLEQRLQRPAFRQWYYNRDRTGESQKRTAKLKAERGKSYSYTTPYYVSKRLNRGRSLRQYLPEEVGWKELDTL